MRLENKVALVTGGGRGIGRAIALGLAREGADVAISYVQHPDQAAETVAAIESLGRRGLAVRADSRAKAGVDNLVAETLHAFDRIDILVNNSGVISFTPFLELTEEEYDRVVDTNMKGYFLVGQAVAKQMVKQGRGKIVNIVSEAQQKALPSLSHYCASKGGAWMLSRGMALDLAKYKINVNIVAPGPTITDLNRERLKIPGEIEKRIARIPWGRMGNPEDVVGAVVYLVSDEAENVTGACIAVDGGTTIV